MKTVFITGASSGIGLATVNYFQNSGWNVVATMRKPEDVSELQDSDNLLKVKLDVTDKKQIKQAVQLAHKRFGRIDVLVNNAGFGLTGIFEAASDQQVEQQFNVNVFGLIDMIKEVLPFMRHQKFGRIINISSMGGKITVPLYSYYHATKWAIEGLSEALRYELSGLKGIDIKVKIIEPGVIATDFYDRSMKKLTTEIEEYQTFIEKMNKRYEQQGSKGDDPIVVAKAVYQAANDNSSKLRYIVGKFARPLILMRKLLPERVFLKLMSSFLA